MLLCSQGMPYERREYVETRDNEMDVWINLERSRSPADVKQIKLVVVPFRKSCNLEDEKYYRRCPGTGRCFKKEYYCSGENKHRISQSWSFDLVINGQRTKVKQIQQPTSKVISEGSPVEIE